MKKLAIVLILFSTIGFVSCEGNMLDNQEQEILNSSEFEQYLSSSIEFYNKLEEIKNIAKAQEKSDNNKVGTYNQSELDEILGKMLSSQKRLDESYPQFATINKDRKVELIFERVKTTQDLSQRIKLPKKKEFDTGVIRLKSASTETRDEYWYCSEEVAYFMADMYSMTQGVECGGYVYADGTAVLYVDTRNTDSTCIKPYTADDVASSYHTHFNSGNFSTRDYNNHTQNYPNDNLVILYNGDVYSYEFEDGMYIP